MTVSKQESPITELPDLKESKPKKTRKDKRETACADKRKHSLNCGICGSGNLIDQGVVYCRKCGIEKDFIVDHPFWRASDIEDISCECSKEIWGKSYFYLEHCVDCGAVEGPICPACKSRCWGKGMNRYCRHCGFRS